MDRKQQRVLNKWLRGQSRQASRWLMVSILLGFTASFFLVAQAYFIAHILHQLIIENTDKHELTHYFVGLLIAVLVRAACNWGRELAGFRAGEQIRVYIRQLILDKLRELGPAYIKGKPAGAWATLLLEQVENMQDFFARYLPQMALSVMIPFVILAVVFPINWAAGLIFLLTAPLVPLFMALVGIKAADASSKNFKALQRLSGHFYDRLQAMTTLKLFDRTDAEHEVLKGAADVLRTKTMGVLKIAFLSSAVLEFFTSISIAITAVYFGFSFIGELDFGHYGIGVTLFAGLFILILAPEFYQPLRELGTYYHAKQQAIGAAESIVAFLETEAKSINHGDVVLDENQEIHISASDLVVQSPEGKTLLGPISFSIGSKTKTAIVGQSGAGKTTLVNAILGFLPYSGSLKINGIERSHLDIASWHRNVSWVGQNPLLVHGSIRDNLTLGRQDVQPETLNRAIDESFSTDFVSQIGMEYMVGDRSTGLSVGQAQRLALARALIQDGNFWLLDEPTASLDANSEKLVSQSLNKNLIDKTVVMVTHQLAHLNDCQQILVLDNGTLVESGDFETLSNTDGVFAQLLSHDHSNQVQGDLDA